MKLIECCNIAMPGGMFAQAQQRCLDCACKILSECMENCSCNSYSETWDKPQVGRIPHTVFSSSNSKQAARENYLYTRLNEFLESENILVPEQHGFRPRLSTTHQLLRVVEFIKDGN
ncbi:hypothetical protein TNCV_1277081 [Trichonephila clavipes]|nr:hypothetical protein TNCV_1277081 [Trichonephila clavipes]